MTVIGYQRNVVGAGLGVWHPGPTPPYKPDCRSHCAALPIKQEPAPFQMPCEAALRSLPRAPPGPDTHGMGLGLWSLEVPSGAA